MFPSWASRPIALSAPTARRPRGRPPRQRHEDAQDLPTVEPDLDPNEAPCQPLETTSVRTPSTELGWTNATSSPNRPRRGSRRSSRAPAAAKLFDRLVHVVGLERDVMHPRPAFREEPPYVRVLARGGDELDAAVAHEERRGDDTLLAQRVTTFEPGAEEPLVHRDRLIQIGHRDAEMGGYRGRAPARCYPRPGVSPEGEARERCRPSPTTATRARRRRAVPRARHRSERLLLEQRLGHAVERSAVLVRSRCASSYAWSVRRACSESRRRLVSSESA